jgi:hypothetical protein
MSTHVNPVWKSCLQFAILAALAWAGYEFLWVRKIFASGGGSDSLSADQRAAIREHVEETWGTDPCFDSVRGNVAWRPRDNFYRVEIIVSIGCEDRAKDLCRDIGKAIEERWKVPSSVWAFDSSGRQIASYVR